MDPEITFAVMLEAAQAGRRQEVWERAVDLIAWLDRGGFPPCGFTVGRCLSICRAVRNLAAPADLAL